MLQHLNEQLSQLERRVAHRNHVESQLKQCNDTVAAEVARLQELEASMQREKQDVENLEGLSLTSLFQTILGNKETQIEKERQEFLRAKLQFDHCRTTVDNLQSDCAALRSELAEFAELDRQRDDLVRQKEEFLVTSNHPSAVELLRLAERCGQYSALVKELKEAISCGQQVQTELSRVATSLSSAAGWGTWDLMGGGMIATMAKHSKIEQAKRHIARVQQLMNRFRRELSDVQVDSDLRVQIGDFAKFADYFFDGLIADWVVQTRIHESAKSVTKVQRQVASCLQELETLYRNTVDELASSERARQEQLNSL